MNISSWYFEFWWVRYGAGLYRFLPKVLLLRCQCTYALNRPMGPSNSDWRCFIHCLEHGFSRIFPCRRAMVHSVAKRRNRAFKYRYRIWQRVFVKSHICTLLCKLCTQTRITRTLSLVAPSHLRKVTYDSRHNDLYRIHADNGTCHADNGPCLRPQCTWDLR